MKQSLLSFGLIVAAALSLTNCAKEFEQSTDFDKQEIVIKEGIPFEVVARPLETKTTNDGLNTNWAISDAISVFHAPAGGSNYVSEGEFVVDNSDLSAGVFKGTLTDAPSSGTHDWYMFYPYDASLTTPANTSTKSFYIGSRADETQTQAGNDNKSHLAGANYPLWGKVTGVEYSETPSINMQHACAFIEINVTNNSGMPLTVSDIEFYATEDIIGQFYVNFVDPSSVVYNDGANVSQAAKLTVTSGAAIADKASAKFYMGIKPFTAPKDDYLYITVNDYEKAIKLSTKAIEFSPGKIKKLNFNYDFKPAYYELASSIAEGDQILIASGISGSVKAMKHFGGGSDNNYKTESVTVSGSSILSNPNIAVLTVGISNEHFTFYDAVRETYLNATGTTGSNYLKESDDIDKYAEFDVNFSSTTPTITCSGKSSRHIMKYNSGSDLFACYSSGQQNVYIFKKAKIVTSLEVVTNPSKTTYTVGESIDLTGALIRATYDDASTADVTTSVTTNAETVLAHAGTEKTVTVSYGGQTATFIINVNKGAAGLSYAKTSYSVAPSASFETPDLTNPHELTVTYSASNSLATVNATTGAVTIGTTTGDVVITAHTNGNDDYLAGDATYTITIEDHTPEYVELFQISSASVVSGTTYQTYTYTDPGSRSWVITFGGNNASMGTNKNNRSKCNLGETYNKYAVSPVTSTTVASAFVNTSTSISNVAKIHYEIGGGSNQSNTTAYLIYSSDGTSFSQMTLTSGTQGHDINTTSTGYDFEFATCSGYFGLLLKQKNDSDQNWRLDNVVLKFYKYE